MTPEDKQLLLKDICGRLPYGVKVYFEKTNEILPLADISQSHMFPLNDIEILLNRKYPLQWCKPYLRPLSSMTEEEKFDYVANVKLETCIPELSIQPRTGAVDWLNAHHFDYCGLIEKGLALEAPEGMYNGN